MLNINVGPQNTQSLKATEIATPSIKVYTSEFFDKNGKKYYLNDEIKELILNDNSSLVERIYTSKEIMEFKDVDIRSNVNINLLGGQFISTRNPNFNGTDDLKIYSFEEKFASCYDPTTEKTSYFEATEWNTGKDLQYFSNNKSVNLSIFVPKGTMNILTIYLESTAESRLKLSVVNKNKDSNQLGPKVIGKFNTVLKDAWKNSLTLKNGLNTIMIKEGCELKLENDPKLPALGKIWILNMNNIITTDNELGVNYTYLGIPNNQVTEFIDKYILKTENKIKDKFYINFPLTNNIIDQTTLDNPYSWIDINNVCSKFVLSEIDVKSLNENNINVIKSSRL